MLSVAIAVILFFDKPLLSLFNGDSEVVKTGYIRLVMVMLSHSFSLLYEVMSGYLRGFAASLERLRLNYIDLYVIHQPYHDIYGAWRAMEELYSSGKVRAIGVDNLTQDRLADFLFWNTVKPAVNLLECNPFFQREDELAYLNSTGILMQAWSPLSAGQNDLFNNEVLANIAAAHNKSVAQVVAILAHP